MLGIRAQEVNSLITQSDIVVEPEVVPNQILYSGNLKSFFEKLNRKQTKINIVHVGDSHIQADLFTGKIRERLQTEFGNGGLGFSFPYRLAKTNGNGLITYTSNSDWNSYRNIYSVNGNAVGLSGIALNAKKDDFAVEINVRNSKYNFTKLKIFTPENTRMFDVATASKTIELVQKQPQKINHRIKKGEVISTIASKYGVTLEQIKKENNLKSNLIRAGKILYIPSGVMTNKTIQRSEFISLELEDKKYYHEFNSLEELSKIYLLPHSNSNRLSTLIFRRKFKIFIRFNQGLSKQLT